MTSGRTSADEYLPLLRHAARSALLAALAVALVLPVLLIVSGGPILSWDEVSQSVEVLLLFVITAAIMGAVPLLCWGAPAYAYAAYRRVNRWYVALAIGIAPAIIVLAVSIYTAALYLGYGAATALLAHVLFLRTPIRNADASLHVTPSRSASPNEPSPSSLPHPDPSASNSSPVT